MSRLHRLIAITLLLAFASSAHAQLFPDFSDRTANRVITNGFPLNSSLSSLAKGDFNQDGETDLVFEMISRRGVIFINREGTLTAEFELPTQFATDQVIVSDINGDSWPDLVIAAAPTSGVVFNLGSDTNGDWLGFSSQITSLPGGASNAVSAGDIDGDGDQDLLLGSISTTDRILLNDGTGNFTAASDRISRNWRTFKVKLIDLNGDGALDMLRQHNDDENKIDYNDGTGFFTQAGRLPQAPNGFNVLLAYSMLDGDFNNDGLPDFVSMNDGTASYVFSNGLDNNNQTAYTTQGFTWPNRKQEGHGYGESGDIDGDGDLDFVIECSDRIVSRTLAPRGIMLVMQEGNQTGEMVNHPNPRGEAWGTIQNTHDVRLMDLNTDGNLDIILAHSNGLSVYINQAPPKEVEILSASHAPAAIGQDANFSAEISGGLAPTYTWDFGDGNTSTPSNSPNATHTYETPGRYFVTLTVNDAIGNDQVSFWQNVHNPLPAGRPSVSMSIVYDADNNRVWNVNPDQNTVSVIDATTQTLISEIPVGEDPRSLAIGADGVMWVVNKHAASLTPISMSTLAPLPEVVLAAGSRPHGIVFTASGDEAFITLEAAGKVLRFDPQSGQITGEHLVGTWPRHLSISANGDQLLVSRFVTPRLPGEATANVATEGVGGEVLVLDTATLSLQTTVFLPYNDVLDTFTSARGIPNYLATPVINPDGLTAWIPSKLDNIYRGHFRDGNGREHDMLVRGIASRINLSTLSQDERTDFENQSPPAAATFGPTGNLLFLVHTGGRSVSVVDAFSGASLLQVEVGFAPIGLTTNPEGSRLFVHNYLARSVSIIDISDLTSGGGTLAEVLETIQVVSSESLSPQVLLGKQLFHDSSDNRLAAQNYVSCASCHNAGSHDGRIWDFTDGGEGLRNTIDLNGRSGMAHGRVHWTANFDEIHDFENDIRNVFSGTGLLSESDFAATEATLGAPKAGLSSDLDALSAYVTSLSRNGQSPFRNQDGSLTAEAILGKEVFRQADCASCHVGQTFTDSPLDLLHDIGTLRAGSGQRLGEAITGLDTPTLRGLWDGAPYLHDGSAATLTEAVQAHNNVSLSSTELAQLVAYLEQIDDNEVSAPVIESPFVTNPGDQSTSVGSSVTLAINATDPQGDVLAFSASGLPTGLAIDTASGVVAGTLTSEGTYNVGINVTDGTNASSISFTWNVLPSAPPAALGSCFLVADNGGGNDVATRLDGSEFLLGATGTTRIEAIAFSPALQTLFAADADELGAIDLTNGTYTTLGSFGSGNGAAGSNRSLRDIDGLAFDPSTGVLYGSVIKAGEEDFLIQIDPATGAVVQNAFGLNIDYVVITSVDGRTNVDDIAIDPITGQLYAIANDIQGQTVLFTIDKDSGTTTKVADLNAVNVEGLAFNVEGTLLGTTGNNGNTVVEIDRVTGNTTVQATLGAGGSDYEALACLVQDYSQVFTGRVFADFDEDGRFDDGDRAQANARVELFRDTNNNNNVDNGDVFVGQVRTELDGSFRFDIAPLGDYVTQLDYSSVPDGATPLDDNSRSATFTDEGEIDRGNTFRFLPDLNAPDLNCYLVADEGFGLSGGDVLTRINKNVFSEEAIGQTGTFLIEAMAFNPQQTSLYVANGKRLGTLDVVSGVYTANGKFGSGTGADGLQSFDDVDGLTFDPNTGQLYGSVSRRGAADLLIEIDPLTGQARQDVFDGADYLVIAPIAGQLGVDDITIDPFDGQLYAVVNGTNGDGLLVEIDRLTGATQNIVELETPFMEGLTFTGEGVLLGTLGSTFQQLVEIDTTTGSLTVLARLGVDGHADYESVACLTNETNSAEGRVFADMNANERFDVGDVGASGQLVRLYRDVLGNGALDASDVLLAETVTDELGHYRFEAASWGAFVVEVVAPPTALTTSSTLGIRFSGFGEQDAFNDFGIASTVSTSTTVAESLPTQYVLERNYPNPFNPETTIQFGLPESAQIRLSVYNVMGQRVAVLVDGMTSAGIHEVRFEAHDLPSGVYLYHLETPRSHLTNSMILLK